MLFLSCTVVLRSVVPAKRRFSHDRLQGGTKCISFSFQPEARFAYIKIFQQQYPIDCSFPAGTVETVRSRILASPTSQQDHTYLGFSASAQVLAQSQSPHILYLLYLLIRAQKFDCDSHYTLSTHVFHGNCGIPRVLALEVFLFLGVQTKSGSRFLYQMVRCSRVFKL